MRYASVRSDEGGRLTRRGLIVILALVWLLAAGGTVAWYGLNKSDDEPDEVATSASPSGDSSLSPTATPSPSPSGGLFEEPEEFAWGDVYFQYRAETGGNKFVNTYFLVDKAKTSEKSELKTYKAAKRCVREFLSDEEFVDKFLTQPEFGVSCYGFDSLKALEYANPSPVTGGMDHLCWRAFFSKSQISPGTGTSSGFQYEEEGCP